METTAEKQHAHELIERLPQGQLSALVRLLETMVGEDPVANALRNAPVDDEPESDEEKQAVEEAREWLRGRGGKGIPHDEAMRKLGLDQEKPTVRKTLTVATSFFSL